MLDVGDGQQPLLGGQRQPGREARGVPARRARRGLQRRAPAAVRPGPLPDHPVRPARMRAEPAARKLPGRRPRLQHDLAPGRRPRAAARAPAVDRWQVFGGSWGSTLALAYAEAHPERVTELVLRGIFTLRKSELDWFYEGGARAALPRHLGGIPRAGPGGRARQPHRRLRRLLADPDPAVHGPAAVAWASWEASGITLLPHPDVVARFAEPTLRARLRPHREPLLRERAAGSRRAN